MYHHGYDIGTLTIPNGTKPSNVIAAYGNFALAKELLIAAPATLTGTVTVRVSLDGGTTYVDYGEVAGTDLTVGAGNTVRVQNLGFTHLKVESGSNEGADRAFVVRAVEQIGC
jgi:hypothetical protein